MTIDLTVFSAMVVTNGMNEIMNDLCPLPLIEAYHEGAVCPPYARLYSSVFSLLQKPANVTVSSHR